MHSKIIPIHPLSCKNKTTKNITIALMMRTFACQINQLHNKLISSHEDMKRLLGSLRHGKWLFWTIFPQFLPLWLYIIQRQYLWPNARSLGLQKLMITSKEVRTKCVLKAKKLCLILTMNFFSPHVYPNTNHEFWASLQTLLEYYLPVCFSASLASMYHTKNESQSTSEWII